VKRRWTILFFIALSPLIGLSWMASKVGFSLFDTFNIGLFGLMVSAAVAGFAAVRSVPRKWPAIVALVASLPMFRDSLRVIDMLGAVLKYFGPSFPIVVFGSLATTVTALVMCFLKPPAPPKDPAVAPARVVD